MKLESSDIQSDEHLSWSVRGREREIKLNRREPDGAGLCTCLNKHFHSNLTATTSKDRVWQLSEARTNWVRKNNKNYRYSDSGRLRPNCFFFYWFNNCIALRCRVWLNRKLLENCSTVKNAKWQLISRRGGGFWLIFRVSHPARCYHYHGRSPWLWMIYNCRNINRSTGIKTRKDLLDLKYTKLTGALTFGRRQQSERRGVGAAVRLKPRTEMGKVFC